MKAVFAVPGEKEKECVMKKNVSTRVQRIIWNMLWIYVETIKGICGFIDFA